MADKRLMMTSRGEERSSYASFFVHTLAIVAVPSSDKVVTEPTPALPPQTGNITVNGQRRRRIVGVAAVSAAAALLLVLSWSEANRWWRLGVFPLLWVGALGFLQAHARICVVLAARGTCESNGTDAVVLDSMQRDVLARRAKAIIRQATILAAVTTFATLALP